MKRALLLLAAALGMNAACATTAPALTLEAQAKKAEVIIRAVLGPPATVQDGAVTYLAYPIAELKETVAGNAASLPQHEGKPALFFLQGAQDLPTLQAGQEVFALLYARKLDSPLVGFNQGLYPVVNGSVQPNSVMQAAKVAQAQAEAQAQAAAQTTGATQTSGAAPATTQTPPLLPVGTLPDTTTPGAATPGAAGQPPAPQPAPGTAPQPAPGADGFPTDPARFRDALRAARGNA